MDTQPEERRYHTRVPNDLAELKGIGPKYAAMLKSIGIDSIKELSHRNPTRLKEMIETRHGKVIGLSEHACQTWVDEVKAFVASPTSPGAGSESDRE